MSGPRKDTATTSYVVARRRTVKVDGKSFGPGQSVTPPDADVAHLLRLGFILEARDDADAGAQGVSVGGLQIRGGTRPGASVA
jgi:hypothetical protein